MKRRDLSAAGGPWSAESRARYYSLCVVRVLVSVVMVVGLFAASATHAAGPKRPQVDVQAMREAIGSRDGDGERFSSAASYAHFLASRVRHHQGDHRGALDELRLALASDDGNAFLLTAMAEEYARLGELERAEATLQRAISANPDHAPAQLLMGRVLYESQRITRARAHLQRAIRLRPKDDDGYLMLAQLWVDQGRPDEAMKVIEQLGEALPGDPTGFRRLGLSFAERGDSARAERMLMRALDRDPGDAEGWVALAQIYEASNRLQKAEEAYGHALERDPENRDVLLAAGRLALRRDDTVTAKGYFDQLLGLSREPELAVKVAFSYLATRHLPEAAEVLDGARASGDEPRLHFYAGLVYSRLKQPSKAAEAYGAVTRDAGEIFFEARSHRASALSLAGRHKDAIELFTQIAKERPDSSSATDAYARALERAGQPKDAEKVLVDALKREPTGERVDALASHYERQNRGPEAVGLLAKALEKTPRDEVLLFSLGATYLRHGERQKSVEHMRALLKLNPDHAHALNFLAYTLAEHSSELDEAERLVLRALELKPDTGAFLDSLGWVYYRRGDTAKAVSTLERAMELTPGEPTIAEHLGDAYSKAARANEAQKVYRQALDALIADPELAETKDQRATIERKIKKLRSL